MMKNKKGNLGGSVTVSVVTYNQGRFLTKALDSVFAQSRKADEVVVVDNGSTDDTAEIVKRYSGKIIYIRNKKNMGAVRAFNQGLSKASSDYVILLSADDWFGEKILEKEAKVLDGNSDIAVVYAQAFTYSEGKIFLRVADPAGQRTTIGRDEFERLLTQGDFVPLLTAMVRTSAYKKLGLMDEKIKFRHDWEFWIKLAKHHKFAYLAEPLAYYRIGGSYGVSSPKFIKSFRHDFGYILKKHLNTKVDKSLYKIRNKAYHFFYLLLADEQIQEGRYIEGIKLWFEAILTRPTNLVNLRTWRVFGSIIRRYANA